MILLPKEMTKEGFDLLLTIVCMNQDYIDHTKYSLPNPSNHPQLNLSRNFVICVDFSNAIKQKSRKFLTFNDIGEQILCI